MWKKVVVSARAGTAIWLYASIFAMSSLAAGPTQKITEKQAVNIAEKFIAENGYTASYPGSKQLVRDLLPLPGTIEAIEVQERSLRHNTLEPKAYGVISRAKSGQGWTVIFQYSMEVRTKYGMPERNRCIDQYEVGRAVTMDEFGHEIHVQHVDIFLKAAQRKF